MPTSSRGNNAHRGRPARTCRRQRGHNLLPPPAAGRASSRALAYFPRPVGTALRASASRHSIQAWPHMGDLTRARAPWNGHYGRHRMGSRGPVPSCPSCIDEWYERGGISVAVTSVAYRCRRPSPAAGGADILDRIRRPLCVHDSIGTQLLRGE